MKKAFIQKVIIISISIVVVAFLILRMINIEETMKALENIRSTLMPFIVGAAIAYILNFMYVKVLEFEKKHFKKLKSDKAKSYIAIAVTEILALSAVTGLFIIIVPSLVESIRNIIDSLPNAIKNFKNIIDNFIENNAWVKSVLGNNANELQDKLKDFLIDDMRYNSEFLREKLIGILSGTFTYITNIIISIIVSGMLLANKEVMLGQSKRLIKAIFGTHKSEIIFEELRIANKKFSGFLVGKIIDSLIVGIIAFIGALALGINYAGLVGFIIGVTNIIPFFGPFIGAIPSAVVVFSQSPKLTIYFLIFIVLLQQVDGNIIGPKCIGNTVQLNSFWVLLSLLVFGELFGIIGLIIGVPTFAVIYDIAGKLIEYRINKLDNKENKDKDEKVGQLE